MRQRFELGRIFLTPGARDRLEQYRVEPSYLLGRHVCGDWGDLDEEDRATNDRALADGARLASWYQIGGAGLMQGVWVITEWDRKRTTITTPEEY